MQENNEKKFRTESLSSLNMFSQCPKKYWFHYWSGKKIDANNDFLVRGRKIHEALENKAGAEEEELEAVRKGYAAIGGKGYKVKGSKYPFLVSEDKLFLELAEVSFGLTDQQKIVEFYDDRAIFRGKIDLIRYYITKDKLNNVSCLDDAIDSVLLVDWKTGENAKNDRKQLSYYSLYIFNTLPDLQEVSCRNILLDKQDQPAIFTVQRTQMVDLWEEILSKINRVRTAEEYYTRQSGLCQYCQYQPFCPEFNDNLDENKSLGLQKFELHQGQKIMLNPFKDYL